MKKTLIAFMILCGVVVLAADYHVSIVSNHIQASGGHVVTGTTTTTTTIPSYLVVGDEAPNYPIPDCTGTFAPTTNTYNGVTLWKRTGIGTAFYLYRDGNPGSRAWQVGDNPGVFAIMWGIVGESDMPVEGLYIWGGFSQGNVIVSKQ